MQRREHARLPGSQWPRACWRQSHVFVAVRAAGTDHYVRAACSDHVTSVEDYLLDPPAVDICAAPGQSEVGESKDRAVKQQLCVQCGHVCVPHLEVDADARAQRGYRLSKGHTPILDDGVVLGMWAEAVTLVDTNWLHCHVGADD